jgi:hypothetical protein
MGAEGTKSSLSAQIFLEIWARKGRETRICCSVRLATSGAYQLLMDLRAGGEPIVSEPYKSKRRRCDYLQSLS